MKRLAQYNGGMRSGIYKYLIENDVELKQAVEEVCTDVGMVVTDHGYGLDDVPKNYPYIALIHPDDEYSRIDYAFVAIADFTDNSEEGTLQMLLNATYNDTTMAPWIARLQDAQKRGDNYFTFDDLDDAQNPDNDRAVNDHQIEFLRQKGYRVEWQKYPRSYDVSGW